MMGSDNIGSAARIKSIRSGLGMTQEQFAAKLGIGVSTLRGWETDSPKAPGHFMALITLLETDISRSKEIFGDDGDTAGDDGPFDGGLSGTDRRKWADKDRYRNSHMGKFEEEKLSAIDRLLADPLKVRMMDVKEGLGAVRGDIEQALGGLHLDEGRVSMLYVSVLLERILGKLDGTKVGNGSVSGDDDDRIIEPAPTDVDGRPVIGIPGRLAQIESTASHHPGVNRIVSVSGEMMARMNRFQADRKGSVCEIGYRNGDQDASGRLNAGAMDLAWKVLSDVLARVYSGYCSTSILFVDAMRSGIGALMGPKETEPKNGFSSFSWFAHCFGIEHVRLAGLPRMSAVNLYEILRCKPFDRVTEDMFRDEAEEGVGDALAYLYKHMHMDGARFWEILLSFGEVFGGMPEAELDGFLGRLYDLLDAVEIPDDDGLNPSMRKFNRELDRKYPLGSAKKFAGGQLSVDTLVREGGIANHALDRCIADAYRKTEADMASDREYFSFSDGALRSRDGKEVYIAYGGNGLEVSDAFYRFLAGLDKWDFAGGKFDEAMAKALAGIPTVS